MFLTQLHISKYYSHLYFIFLIDKLIGNLIQQALTGIREKTSEKLHVTENQCILKIWLKLFIVVVCHSLLGKNRMLMVKEVVSMTSQD